MTKPKRLRPFFPDMSQNKNSLLTATQREYLQGESGLSDSAERQKRADIRHRIRDGIKDFKYLSELENDDLVAAFEDKDASQLREEVINAYALLYRVCRDKGLRIEYLMEEAIFDAERRHRDYTDRAYEVQGVHVDMDVVKAPKRDTSVTVKEARDKMSEGDRLTDAEFRKLIEDDDVPDEMVKEYSREWESEADDPSETWDLDQLKEDE